SVSVTELGVESLVISSTAQVANALLILTPVTAQAVEGHPFNLKVATFVDANLTATASDFSATITRGNGTSYQGTIVQSGPGRFAVYVADNYQQATNDTLQIAISNTHGGAAATVPGSVAVTPAPLTAQARSFIVPPGGQSQVQIASFTSGN